MSQIIDKLRKRIERDSKKCSNAYFNGEGFMGLDSVQSVDESFTAGASSVLPVVEKLVEALDSIKGGYSLYDTTTNMIQKMTYPETELARRTLAELEKYAAEGE